MKINIALIRHGFQREESGFFGKTDIDLTKGDIKLIVGKKDKYPKATLVFSSSLKRCVDTARIIYPDIPVVLLKELNAPDYGDFEGKLFGDLKDNLQFEKWLNIPTLQAFPGGEEPFHMIARSTAAFKKLCDEAAGKGLDNIAVITHKIVIQAILQRYCVPRIYTDRQPTAGGGYLLSCDALTSAVAILEEI